MFKPLENLAQVVEETSKTCGGFRRLFTVVEFYLNVVVGKIVGFMQVNPRILRVVTHKQFNRSLSVNEIVVHEFHKTYNNLLLFNKFNFCNWGVV